MRKLVFSIVGLATGSLIVLGQIPNYAAWGSESTHSIREGHSLWLSQGSGTFEPVDPSTPSGPFGDGGTGYYEPPKTSDAPRRTTGGGTRSYGCGDAVPIDITALAPQTHIGQTAATRPTLTWFVADETPYPVEIQLYRYLSSDPDSDRVERLGIYNAGPSQLGYMTFTLPDSEPDLVVGETYRWKVILQCSPSQPSRNRLDEADFQVVAPPADLALADDPVQQAQQYAAAGLWYDAIAVLSQAPVSPAAAAFRRELVAELAALEVTNPNDEFSLLSDRLNYIAEQD
ncbi:MAG: DUF928 domain-containing protein [Nodosilinea sp.]